MPHPPSQVPARPPADAGDGYVQEMAERAEECLRKARLYHAAHKVLLAEVEQIRALPAPQSPGPD